MFFIPITLLYALSTALLAARPTRASCPEAHALGSLNIKFLQDVRELSLRGGRVWNEPFADFVTTRLNHGAPIEGMCLYIIRKENPSGGPKANLIVKISHDIDNPKRVTPCEEKKSGLLVAKGSIDDGRMVYVVHDVPVGARDSPYVAYNSLPEYKHTCAKLAETTDEEIIEQCNDLINRLRQAQRQYINHVATYSSVINLSLNLSNTLFRIEQMPRDGSPKVIYGARFFGGWDNYLKIPHSWVPITIDNFMKWISKRESNRAFSGVAHALGISDGRDSEQEMPSIPAWMGSCGVSFDGIDPMNMESSFSWI